MSVAECAYKFPAVAVVCQTIYAVVEQHVATVVDYGDAYRFVVEVGIEQFVVEIAVLPVFAQNHLVVGLQLGIEHSNLVLAFA